MDDLVAWLQEQLAEDERIARAAANVVGPVRGATDWQVKKSLSDEGGEYWSITTTPPDDLVPTVELAGGGMSGGGVHEESVAAHVAAHDPARVLREIDATRRLIRAHAKWCEGRCEAKSPEGGFDAAHYWNIKVRAEVYSDRPGYRAEWRP
ncbi:hypothetical protein E2C11_16465 [Streptomyces lavendulae]|nr:DUF6221 family protein [Streptomyces lavendulae]TXJ78600.1 hypothetical protein E2C11_16465 [Streptomyces lavendulae]